MQALPGVGHVQPCSSWQVALQPSPGRGVAVVALLAVVDRRRRRRPAPCVVVHGLPGVAHDVARLDLAGRRAAVAVGRVAVVARLVALDHAVAAGLR